LVNRERKQPALIAQSPRGLTPTPPVNTVARLEWVTVRIDASQKQL
jgi:hypothetical protein